MRLSIEVTPEQHQCLKAAAALEGKTIKAYVLERALADVSDMDQGQRELEALIRARLAAAERGSVSRESVDQIIDGVLEEEQKYGGK